MEEKGEPLHEAAVVLNDIEYELRGAQLKVARLQEERLKARERRAAAIAAMIHENPRITHTRLAALFGVSEGTIRIFRSNLARATAEGIGDDSPPA